MPNAHDAIERQRKNCHAEFSVDVQSNRLFELPEHERQRCEVWTRVMGYHRPVSEFNLGKQCEHRRRQHFDEP